MRLVAAIVGAAGVALSLAPGGMAAWTYTCPSEPPAVDTGMPDAAVQVAYLRVEQQQACVALAERLQAVDAKLAEQLDDDGTTTITGRVALSRYDRDRLTLAGLGPWALLGVTLCLLFASRWHSAWRFLR